MAAAVLFVAVGILFLLFIVIAGRSSERAAPRRMRAALAGPASADACRACGGPLATIGVERFRIGGSTGGWKLLFGEWAELGEDMLDMEVLACQRCRRVELRVPQP